MLTFTPLKIILSAWTTIMIERKMCDNICRVLKMSDRVLKGSSGSAEVEPQMVKQSTLVLQLICSYHDVS